MSDHASPIAGCQSAAYSLDPPAFRRTDDNDWVIDRRPGEGRYAQLEREQRWILDAVPAEVEFVAEIVDRYILGTRLRVRRMATETGVVFKLAQKVRPIEQDPAIVKLTNMYLSADEFDAVATLPAAELHKSRWRLPWSGRSLAVDQFRGRWTGLILGEVELDAGDELLPNPPAALRDVTSDDRFSGGSLARTSDHELAVLFDELQLSFGHQVG